MCKLTFIIVKYLIAQQLTNSWSILNEQRTINSFADQNSSNSLFFIFSRTISIQKSKGTKAWVCKWMLTQLKECKKNVMRIRWRIFDKKNSFQVIFDTLLDQKYTIRFMVVKLPLRMRCIAPKLREYHCLVKQDFSQYDYASLQLIKTLKWCRKTIKPFFVAGDCLPSCLVCDRAPLQGCLSLHSNSRPLQVF